MQIVKNLNNQKEIFFLNNILFTLRCSFKVDILVNLQDRKKKVHIFYNNEKTIQSIFNKLRLRCEI